MSTIAQELTLLNNTKQAIAAAITEKGGTVPSTFSEYSTAIRALPDISTKADISAVNTAISTINSNFTNLKDEFTQQTRFISPTVTFASGWSIYNNDNVSIKTLTGRVAIISFSVKCTSALTAGTSYKPFASFSFPSGITLAMGAGVNATRRCWIYFNGANTEIIPEIDTAANLPLYARGLIGLNIPSTATSYMPTITTVSNI